MEGEGKCLFIKHLYFLKLCFGTLVHALMLCWELLDIFGAEFKYTNFDLCWYEH